MKTKIRNVAIAYKIRSYTSPEILLWNIPFESRKFYFIIGNVLVKV